MMYETTSKETEMMQGRTTNEAAWVCRHMCAFTKQFHRVACWSGVSSWHIQNRNCVEAARSCVATSAKETHISAKGHRKLDTFLSFLSGSSAIVPKKKKHVYNKCPVLHEATTCVHAKEEKTQKDTAQLPTRLGLIESTFFSVRKLLLTGWAM